MFYKILFLSILLSVVVSEKVRYDNYTLYRLHPQNEEHLQYLQDLYRVSDGLDFWNTPTRVGDFVSVVSPPESRGEFEESLLKRDINLEVMLENIQEAFDAQIYSRRKRDTRGQLFWTNYQTMEDIYDWFDYLAETYSDVVSVVDGGMSFEGRNITGIRISRGNPRRAFFLTGGQVGADWLSPTVVCYTAEQLVLGEDAEALAATEDFEWYIFPILNPDGHEFTQESIRLWVKNRRPTVSSFIGVDLTRNWNSHWGVGGASFTPSDNNFVGIGPFSEIETRSISRFIETIGPRISGFLSFSSFGQRLLLPFAHTTDPMYNYNDMITIGRRAMGSLAVRYNTQYLVDTAAAINGVTGSIGDWVKFRFNPPVVASYLLRDTGMWGYTLPVNQVQPTCEETYDSVLAIIREAKFINVL